MPGTKPIKILKHKFYSTEFFQAFWLDPKYFQPIKILEKLCSIKFTLLNLYRISPCTENTHQRGKYHCTADLLFDWFGFDQRSKTVFFKWATPGLFFFIFRLFNTQLTVHNNCSILINFCRWLDSNRRPLVSEATTLPTEPQPLPKK